VHPVLEEVFVLKIRIKFQKIGSIKFIGHLDLVRAWQKIFRRSGIPIAYSEGFNPHQIFSIASPLAVGITSDGEYLDLKLTADSYDLGQLVDQINAVCPPGIIVLDAVALSEQSIAGMAACYASLYTIEFSEELTYRLNQSDTLNDFFSQESIVIAKKNKKGKFNDLDLKTGLFDYKRLAPSKIQLLLATGSTLNVKPELIMTALMDYSHIELPVFTDTLYYWMHRIEIYQSLEPVRTLLEGVS
jgi:radical SAM-linked protein